MKSSVNDTMVPSLSVERFYSQKCPTSKIFFSMFLSIVYFLKFCHTSSTPLELNSNTPWGHNILHGQSPSLIVIEKNLSPEDPFCGGFFHGASSVRKLPFWRYSVPQQSTSFEEDPVMIAVKCRFITDIINQR